MDKSKLSKLILSSNVNVVSISLAISKAERDRLVRDFVKKTDRHQDGEVILIMIRT